MNRYTSDDWLEGRVSLIYSAEEILPSDEILTPRVTWDDFDYLERNKIKKIQQETFEKELNKKTAELKSLYQERYKKSRQKQKFLDQEINGLERVLFEKLSGEPEVVFRFSRSRILVFTYVERQVFENYVDRHIVNGIDRNYDYIQSPNDKNDNRKIPVQVYAESLFEHLIFLKTLKDGNYDEEMDYEIKRIFSERKYYELFNLIVKEFPSNQRNLALYAQLYHHFKAKHRGFILKNVREVAFFEFLKKYFGLQSKGNRLKYRINKDRLKSINEYIEEYQKSN